MPYVPPNVDAVAEEVELFPEEQFEKSSKGHINNWFNASIDGAVCHGNELRKKKPAPVRPNVGSPKVMSFKTSRKSRKQRIRSKERRPKKTVKADRGNARSLGTISMGDVTRKSNTLNNQDNTNACGCSYWPMPSNTEAIWIRKTYTQKDIKLRTRINSQTRCSTRTALLAMPSKRHCLETWRTKSYLLPDYMVERLKEYVTDQRPVIKITDAINCFTTPKRRPHKKPKNRLNTILQKPMPLRCGGPQAYSIIFAKKIAQKLSTPMNITLNSDLQKIYKVVNDDITEMTSPKRNRRGQQLQKSKAAQSDVSKKVTIWIAGILDELKNKLLEEDLLGIEEDHYIKLPNWDFIYNCHNSK